MKEKEPKKNEKYLFSSDSATFINPRTGELNYRTRSTHHTRPENVDEYIKQELKAHPPGTTITVRYNEKTRKADIFMTPPEEDKGNL